MSQSKKKSPACNIAEIYGKELAEADPRLSLELPEPLLRGGPPREHRGLLSASAFAQGTWPGHGKGPGSPQVRQGVHRHGPHGGNQGVGWFRLDDGLRDTAGHSRTVSRQAARCLPVQAGEGALTHSGAEGGGVPQGACWEDLTFLGSLGL